MESFDFLVIISDYHWRLVGKAKEQLESLGGIT